MWPDTAASSAVPSGRREQGELRPLQSVVLTFRLPPRAFEVYREDGSTFVPEGGEVLVGGDGPPM